MILYEIFIIEADEEFQYQKFIPIKYVNSREEAIEFCRQGNKNNKYKFYWRYIITD